MAIKIINDKPHSSVVKEVICRNCGVTLEYTPDDTKSRMVHDYGGGCDEYKFIRCPKCSKEVSV